MSQNEITERVATAVERSIAAYDPAFRRVMTLSAPQAANPEALAAALAALPIPSGALADTLLVGVGAGEPVPQRLLPRVEAYGEPLWRMAFLLPRTSPSPGSTIDPRYYVADCRINPALASYLPLPELQGAESFQAHDPPSDTLWDAMVVAALLEANPPTLTRDGKMRKDVERRILRSLGEDENRWALALALARATGLAREAAGRLYGRPESYPRRLPLLDPMVLLEGEVALAGAALLRVVGPAWVALDPLLAALARRCPDVLTSERDRSWATHEAVWFRAAASALHRAGVLDASLGPEGVRAVRRAGPKPPRPQGFLLTPDREILVAPGELPGPEYGRLCRAAPYESGDVVHRHRLTREGVAADIAAGYDDLLSWLASRSRIGVPPSVRSTVEQWASSAVRVTLLTGVTVLEKDGEFTVHAGRVPIEARLLYYDDLPPARFYLADGVLHVPFGEDALTVRAVVARLGEALPTIDRCHRWRLAPGRIPDPDRVLDQLRRYHNGPLPPELEAVIHASGGRDTVVVESAVVLHLPHEAADALRRDRVLGPLVGRDLGGGQCVVDRRDLPTVTARLNALGYRVGGVPHSDGGA